MRILLDHNVPAPLRYWLIVISTSDWTHIRNSKSAVLDAVSVIMPGAFVEVEIPLR